MKKSEKRGLLKRIERNLREIILEKYSFSIMFVFILIMALISSSNLAYANPIKENVSVIWDTYVSQTQPTNNFGTSTALSVREHATTFVRTYIMFDLSNYTNLTSISFAKICFYLTTDGTTSNISSYIVRGGLKLETTMNWTNQPCGTAFNNATACNITIGNEIVSTGVNTYRCLNVTYSAQMQIDKNLSNMTFALKTPEITSLTADVFNSREAETFKPYAEITYCTPNWSVQYTSCGISDNYTKYYTDTNACESSRGLPADNGTLIACNYCLPNWNASNSSCTTANNFTETYTDNNTCCFKTGLSSDCTPPANNGTKYYCDYCLPNWQDNLTLTPCNISDNRSISYSDNNTCCAKTGLGTDCLTYPIDNGTLFSCNYCTPFWFCGSHDGCLNYWKSCLYINSQNATNYGTCCNITNLGTDCTFTGDLGQYKEPCGEMITYFTTNPDYPYVDCNSTETFGMVITINDTRQDFEHLFFEFPTIPYTFNWTWSNATQSYSINLLFTTEGDYPYVIWSDYPYGVMANITGTLKVRCPYYINVRVFRINPKNQSNPYIDNLGYITAEFTDNYVGVPYYNVNEQFLRPIGFKQLFTLNVFHAPYINGLATLKLWERNKQYAFRLIDGQINFYEGVYSKINMTKSYGTNIYLGITTFNGTNEDLYIFLTESEIHPYQTLINILYIVLLFVSLIGALVILFIPPYTPFAIPLAIGGVFILSAIRIAIWFIFKF